MLNVEQIQNQVIQNLEKAFGTLSYADIWNTAEILENNIPIILENHFFNFVTYHIPSVKILDRNRNEFLYNKEEYTINVVQDALDQSQLIVCITPISCNGNEKFNTHLSVNVSGFGKIKKLTLVILDIFSLNIENAYSFLRTICETVYNWISLKIERSIDEQAIISNALTYKIGAFFSNRREVLQNLWFFTIQENKGFYILSQENIDHALNIMDKKMPIKKESAIRLLSEILNLVIPYESTLASNTFKNNKSIDFLDWSNQAKYSEEKVLLIRGEKVIFTEDITIYPIHNGDKLKLVAMTPTYLKELVEPIILEKKTELSYIFKYHFSRVERILNMLKKVKSHPNVAMYGEFIGGVIKALTSPN